jgi:apolipoprotein D and lipocalin family protein
LKLLCGALVQLICQRVVKGDREKTMRALLIAVSLVLVSGCATRGEGDPSLRPVAKLDAGKFYTGTWYEIGRRPMKLTDGCVAGGTTYTPKGGAEVQVLDFCRDKSPTGKLKTIGGPARIVESSGNAKLRVSYRFLGIVPIQRDYWVLDLADDYSWFISADPTFHDLWIYTRNPQPSSGQTNRLVVRAKALGYDTTVLEFPATGR